MSFQTCLRRTAISRSWSAPRPFLSSAMPLRARIMNPAFGTRQYSSNADLQQKKPDLPQEQPDLPQEQPEYQPDDVLFGKVYGVRTIELNRPKKLNSLNGSMARKIIPRLREWSKSQLANIIVLKGNGRALCAGGDVAALAKQNEEGPEGQRLSAEYFALEYQLDHMIATYSKPYVAFMDGITMGGGVGLSVHAPFRIATENTVFAMPETTIGFFPDVGASFFLPRMDGRMGTYLALTSDQLKGVDTFYHGIATHFVHSSSLPDLEARLGELIFKDEASMNERFMIINSTIEEFVNGLPSPRPQLTGTIRQAIDYCFGPFQKSIHDIIGALSEIKTGGDPVLQQWASKTLTTMEQRSPTSVMVTLQQMRICKDWSISEAFQREFNLASKFMAHHDFVEGVNARLIRRQQERPNWQPNTFADVTQEEIDAFFGNRPTLELLGTDDYDEYPHAWLSLPSEKTILSKFTETESKKATIEHFLRERDEKVGVREKVEEVLERAGN